MSTWKQFADKFNHLGMYSCIVCPFIKDNERQKIKKVEGRGKGDSQISIYLKSLHVLEILNYT